MQVSSGDSPCEVCCKMNYESIFQMGFLREHEVLNLLMPKVRIRVASDSALKKMAVQAVKECAGLSLDSLIENKNV